MFPVDVKKILIAMAIADVIFLVLMILSSMG